MSGRSFLCDLWFCQTLRHKNYIYIYIYTYIEFIREAAESAQPDWELDVQQRSYFVLITIVSMYGISNTSHQIRYKVLYFVSDLMRCIANTIH